jgi:hypothetical protein
VDESTEPGTGTVLGRDTEATVNDRYIGYIEPDTVER